MATLYVTEPGARVEKEYRRLLVVKEDQVIMEVMLHQVGEVVLIGNTGMTTHAMLALLDAGVGMTLIARSGRLLGRLRPAEARNLPLRQLQYEKVKDPRICLSISQAIVIGKLENSRVMARRMLQRMPQTEFRAQLSARLLNLERAQLAALQATGLADLRGIEGSAARDYFSILRAALQWKGQPFERRQRRPPPDPVNALLSFGYSLLMNAIFTALEITGLDPYAGFFHANKYGRPALALDLMEEFRPVIVDSIVLTMINNRRIQEKHFEQQGDATFLTKRGLKVYLQHFSQRIYTEIFHPLAGRKISYQKCFEVQSRQIRRVIENEENLYRSIRIR